MFTDRHNAVRLYKDDLALEKGVRKMQAKGWSVVRKTTYAMYHGFFARYHPNSHLVVYTRHNHLGES